MKRLSQVTSTFLLMATLAPFGFAQATGAVNATTNAAANAAANVAAQQQAAQAASAAAARGQGAINASTTAAQNAANATTSAAQNAAANANAAASTAAQNAAAAGATAQGVNAAGSINSATSGSTTVRGGDMPAAGINASTSANAAANGQAGSLSVSSLASQGASASLNSDTVVSQIRNTSGTTRDRVTGEVQTRLDASAQAVATTQTRASELRGDAQVRFQQAVTAVHRSERQVRVRLEELRNAAADKISSERSRLADSYEAYARAVAELEVAGSASASN